MSETAPAAVFDARDHRLMAHALELAERGRYTAKPNPMVGCVIANGEQIVGEGWHLRSGQSHAEPVALSAAGNLARGATMYVTLEPCAHTGKTPPCADAVIRAGLARVVVAARDPDPRVAGAGLERMKAAGIQVDIGLMADLARIQNRGFFSRIEKGRPYTRVKLGMSIDARTALADGESRWITSTASRRDVARLRAQAGAVLAGSGTIRADNPHLTVRRDDLEFEPPLRVVLDAGLALPQGSNVLDDAAPTLLIHASDAKISAALRDRDRVGVAAKGDALDLHAVVAVLAERGVNELQVESGHTLAGAFFAAGLVDELVLYMAPCLLGTNALPLLGQPSPAVMGGRAEFDFVDVRRIGPDLRLTLTPRLAGTDG